ncbi:MAG: hypothetical protein A2087_13465 [Spirochaetes bacterium GWD1_61_31]|nr:MAG: hypothetical protein A2Y37_02870 [Spirochaetes bacterium GWB1_60_80]OHD39498.1 MAG: hypothetical protein A2087_13465 [Spirochaetes bacterium GWD1_61_31]OHD45550.1 MAG: hypothetical protein A2Y35_03140 [Spirochaetes bacterium GWE1_60_18]HAP44697.1 hypothetical protein [Spirochaetaceae bacterium]HBO40332.1 hypothetical protein [Spirochaetaceae bacterium]
MNHSAAGGVSGLYRIILVDDEDEVRGRISSKISEGSGFEVVATAGNGYDALELIERHAPHVVLTDIKMPYIDGIELAAIIRREYPTVRIGFITGYDEFDYAREAIELNVRSYLTKPLTQEDISRFLGKLKQELDCEMAENLSREEIRLRYEASLPLAIENWFVSCLAAGSAGGPSSGAGQADIEQLRQHGVSLDDAAYRLAAVQVERQPEHWGAIEYQKLKLAVRARLDQLLKQEQHEHYHFPFNDSLVFIIKQQGSAFSQQLDVLLNRMVKTNEIFLSVGIDIGVSALHRDFRQLGMAWEEADRALSSSRFGTVSRIAYFEEAAIPAAPALRFAEGDAKGLEHCLRYADDQALAAFLDDMKRSAAASGGDKASLSAYMLNVAAILVNYAATCGVELNDLLGEDILAIVQKLRGLDQLFGWVHNLATRIRECGVSSRASNAQRLLDLAMAGIRRNFADPELTMEGLCESLAISPSYLGQLFKKFADTSFVKFLTTVRMEKARELLATTGDRIVELAAACGYRDVYYFSHSFKKHYGVSPKKYREETA